MAKRKEDKSKPEKILLTYKFRIKDSNKKLVKSLYEKSGLVNFVWNYCNDVQKQAVNRGRKWLSGFVPGVENLI